MEFDNAMRRQVMSLPALIRQQLADMEPKTRTILTTPEIFSIQRIVLTGCGDSFAAALATKHIFELLTNIPTETVATVDLARYYHPKQVGFAPNNPLVIAISHSGNVARISEAVQFINQNGGFTLGITANLQSELGTYAKKSVQVEIPSFESCPGVRSYLVSVMTLLLLAIRIGEVRGIYSMDQANEYRNDILNQADVLEKVLPEMDSQVLETAKKWKDFPVFDFVGTGFDYAAAFYGHAKILEAVGKPAMRINGEEWLHLNFFIRDLKHTGTVMVANTTNPAISRMKETLHYAGTLGRPLMIITDGGKSDFNVEADYVKVPKTKFQITMPISQFIPTALLAGYLSEMAGEEYGRGCKGPWAFAAGGDGVTKSALHIRKTVLE